MKHKIKDQKEDGAIEWSINLSGTGNLCVKANGDTAVLIDEEGKLTICKSGTALGIKFRLQVRGE